MSNTAATRDEQSRAMGSLQRISAKLNSTLDIEDLLDGLVAEALELTEAEGGLAALGTAEGMSCNKYVMASGAIPWKHTWASGTGWPGWLIHHKLSYISNNAGSDPLIVPEIRERFSVRSGIATPILDAAGEVIGFFEIHNRRSVEPFTLHDQDTLAAVAQIASVAIQNDFRYRRLRELSAQLLRLQDEERRRLSRELHDSTGQYLDMLIADLKMLTRSAAVADGNAQRLLDESLSMAEECSRQMRTISHLLHPPLLDELGLESALRWYIDGFARRSGIRVTIEVDERCRHLGAETNMMIFRIVQEALTNIHRHSGSRTASVQLIARVGRCELRIADSGKGMPAGMSRNNPRAPFGIGIIGMEERVRQLRGTLAIESGSSGTVVRSDLPLCEEGDDDQDPSLTG